jgi:hypothetical protein
MSGHAQKFGGNFPQIFVVKFEKMKVVRKTPEFSKKVKISCIYKFLVVGNPPKLVHFLTVMPNILFGFYLMLEVCIAMFEKVAIATRTTSILSCKKKNFNTKYV